MKVRELVSQLQLNYLPDDEIIVAYWDKETIENYGSPELSKTQWSLVVDDYESGEWGWQNTAAEEFVEIAERIVGDE
jgi:hypothetical protein